MKVLKIFTGGPKTYQWQGKEVLTSIFKKEVSGPVAIQYQNMTGDQQSDLKHHGGTYKAVYSYSQHDYVWWKQQHPEFKYEDGIFGENILIDHMNENDVFVGDRFKFGTAVLEIAAARYPCAKLGLRFGDPTVVKKFFESNRWGIYWRVTQEGEVSPGDSIVKTYESATKVTARDLFLLAMGLQSDSKKIEKLLEFQDLDPAFRERLLQLKTN